MVTKIKERRREDDGDLISSRKINPDSDQGSFIFYLLFTKPRKNGRKGSGKDKEENSFRVKKGNGKVGTKSGSRRIWSLKRFLTHLYIRCPTLSEGFLISNFFISFFYIQNVLWDISILKEAHKSLN